MSGLFLALIIITALILVAIVLIQNPKGGGLASGLTNVNYVTDHKTTTDVLEKGTFIVAGVLLALCLGYNIMFSHTSQTNEDGGIEITTNPTTTTPTTEPTTVPTTPQQDS